MRTSNIILLEAEDPITKLGIVQEIYSSITGFNGLLRLYKLLFKDTPFGIELDKVIKEYEISLEKLDSRDNEKISNIQNIIGKRIVEILIKAGRNRELQKSEKKGKKDSPEIDVSNLFIKPYKKGRLDLGEIPNIKSDTPEELKLKQEPTVRKSAHEIRKKQTERLINDKDVALDTRYREFYEDPEGLKIQLWLLAAKNDPLEYAEKIKAKGYDLFSLMLLPDANDPEMELLYIAYLHEDKFPEFLEMSLSERIAFVLSKLRSDQSQWYYDNIPSTVRYKLNSMAQGGTDDVLIMLKPETGKEITDKKPPGPKKPVEPKDAIGYIIKFWQPSKYDVEHDPKYNEILSGAKNAAPFRIVFVPFIPTNIDPEGKETALAIVKDLKNTFVVTLVELTKKAPILGPGVVSVASHSDIIKAVKKSKKAETKTTKIPGLDIKIPKSIEKSPPSILKALKPPINVKLEPYGRHVPRQNIAMEKPAAELPHDLDDFDDLTSDLGEEEKEPEKS